MQEVQFYVYCFRRLGGHFCIKLGASGAVFGSLGVTWGAFSSLGGTFEVLATPGSKINDFTCEKVPRFEHLFWTIEAIFSSCFLSVWVLRVVFLEILWFLGSLVRFIFGCIFEKCVFFIGTIGTIDL